MLPYVLTYLALGAVISLAHPWIRGGMAKLWRTERTNRPDVFLIPFFGCLAFVIASVCWPIALRSAYKAGKEPKDEDDCP
jgi:hypothetical protein